VSEAKGRSPQHSVLEDKACSASLLEAKLHPDSPHSPGSNESCSPQSRQRSLNSKLTQRELQALHTRVSTAESRLKLEEAKRKDLEREILTLRKDAMARTPSHHEAESERMANMKADQAGKIEQLMAQLEAEREATRQQLTAQRQAFETELQKAMATARTSSDAAAKEAENKRLKPAVPPQETKLMQTKSEGERVRHGQGPQHRVHTDLARQRAFQRSEAADSASTVEPSVLPPHAGLQAEDSAQTASRIPSASMLAAPPVSVVCAQLPTAPSSPVLQNSSLGHPTSGSSFRSQLSTRSGMMARGVFVPSTKTAGTSADEPDATTSIHERSRPGSTALAKPVRSVQAASHQEVRAGVQGYFATEPTARSSMKAHPLSMSMPAGILSGSQTSPRVPLHKSSRGR